MAGRYCEGKIKMASEKVSRKMVLEIKYVNANNAVIHTENLVTGILAKISLGSGMGFGPNLGWELGFVPNLGWELAFGTPLHDPLLDFTMAKRRRNGKVRQVSPLTPRPNLNGRQNF